MSADCSEPVPAPSPAAGRMRRSRKRWREAKQRHASGIRDVQVALQATEIDLLVQTGFLDEKNRDDPEALRSAIRGLIYWAMQDSALIDAYELVPCPDCGGQGTAHCCDGICEQPAVEVLNE